MRFAAVPADAPLVFLGRIEEIKARTCIEVARRAGAARLWQRPPEHLGGSTRMSRRTSTAIGFATSARSTTPRRMRIWVGPLLC
jgi:hypothetical protein